MTMGLGTFTKSEEYSSLVLLKDDLKDTCYAKTPKHFGQFWPVIHLVDHFLASGHTIDCWAEKTLSDF